MHSVPDFIYLDHNATTPLLPEVAEAMRACDAAAYANPASQHESGRRARRMLEDARERIGELLGARAAGIHADRVIFTSGGTEANNLALCGLANRQIDSASPRDFQPGHIVVSALEHPSVTEIAKHLSQQGWQVDWIAANQDGLLQIDYLAAKIRPETRLVAAMLGNNETGVLQPVSEMAAICREYNVPLHTDAAQVVGKLPVDFHALGVATLSAAAHKFHGPLGIGVLVVRHDIALAPQLFGGFQQAGVRPGTESVTLAVGMCRALELWHAEQHERATRMTRLRDRFERSILEGWPAATVIGSHSPRLPHVSNIAFVSLDRQALFMALDQAGIACSTGSACASGSSEPSPALVAMGLERAVFGSALRFSFGIKTTDLQVDEAAHRILFCCNKLRPQNTT